MAAFALRGSPKRPKKQNKTRFLENGVADLWPPRKVSLFSNYSDTFLATRGDSAILASEGTLRVHLEISLFSRVVDFNPE